MTIKDKLKEICKTETYTFCGILFDLFPHDLIRIYDKVDGVCLYSCRLDELENIPEDILNKEYKRDVLFKFSNDDDVFSVCFYLEAPDIIERGIDNKLKFI